MNFWYFSDVAAGSAEKGDDVVVDVRQCYRRQLCAGKHDQRSAFQRHRSNQRCVLFYVAAVARVDLNTLYTTVNGQPVSGGHNGGGKGGRSPRAAFLEGRHFS